MSPKDYVGTYGENCFREIMTRLHGRSEPFFRLNYLGEKQETVDFLVELVAPIPRACLFFVQVKTTRQVRTGGSLPIKLSREQISQMARSPIPAYVVAVNEHNGLAYILFVDRGKEHRCFPDLVSTGSRSHGTALARNQGLLGDRHVPGPCVLLHGERQKACEKISKIAPSTSQNGFMSSPCFSSAAARISRSRSATRLTWVWITWWTSVRNGNGASYRRFGIIAKGFWDKTSLGQPPELEGISRLLGGHEYPFPVALFAFTMEENLAFYSWIMEPAIENGAAQLRMRKRGLLQELTFSNLDKLLDDVNAWYDAFFTALVRSN